MASIRRALALLAVSVIATGVHAQDTEQQRAEAEARFESVSEEIRDLQAQLESARSQHSGLQSDLRALDLEVQSEALELREIRGIRADHEAELDRLEAQRDRLVNDLSDRNEQLAEQLRAAYRVGRQSRLQVLLNQDSPAQLSRTLAYYEYFNRDQQERMEALRSDLSAIDEVQAGIDSELLELAAVEQRQAASVATLEQRRSEQAGAASALAASIGEGEARLEELEQNRRDLAALLERLSDALADIPLDLGNERAIAEQKGALPMPVGGSVAHAFGQPRGSGLNWEGWLIQADTGSDVVAVARGRVAYSDWLRGYGLLMIIDHGNGYMTLYGHNESLLHGVGEWVAAGQPVATVGTVGGQTGLYFEIRKDGRVQDPAAWLKR